MTPRAPLVVLVFGGYLVIQGDTSIGVVVAFVSAFDRLANPLRELIAYCRFAAQAAVQHKMIAEWMEAKNRHVDSGIENGETIAR